MDAFFHYIIKREQVCISLWKFIFDRKQTAIVVYYYTVYLLNFIKNHRDSFAPLLHNVLECLSLFGIIWVCYNSAENAFDFDCWHGLYLVLTYPPLIDTKNAMRTRGNMNKLNKCNIDNHGISSFKAISQSFCNI